ncbi:MAG: TRAP transporter small permease [Burkholderiales bacterium]|nr:TRAP transporter small permease [Burkholderiales bacterium]
METEGEREAGGAKRVLGGVTRAIAVTVGHLGIAALAVLAFSVCLTVSMRWAALDTEWVFDLNVFALVWLAFTGAALTSLNGTHVNAGIALERFFPRARTALNTLRALVIIPFLLLVVALTALQTWQASVDHQVTFDLAAWPVWAAQVSMPLGAAAWACAEIAKLVRPGMQRENDPLRAHAE